MILLFSLHHQVFDELYGLATMVGLHLHFELARYEQPLGELLWAEASCAEERLCGLLLESLVHGAGFHIGKATYSYCLVSE
jgi:hypothetical protein